MDNTTLGNIFQEISDEFTGMEPCSLDELEEKVLAAMHKLGSCLMDSKVSDWNTQLHHKTCARCGTKLTHKQKKRQIATWGVRCELQEIQELLSQVQSCGVSIG